MSKAARRHRTGRTLAEYRRNRDFSRTPEPGGKNSADVIESVRLTHPDRVLYPDVGLTKRGLAEYYVEIADRILPEVIQ
ncbi:MAG: hypothetical protein ACREEV_04045, partial [Dongiaceae bacterium]